jgi:phage tail-like protein
MELEALKEGGENRFVHQLPVRTSYSELVLKRGKFMGSGVLYWCVNAIEILSSSPQMYLSLCWMKNHLPLYNWYVINAIPKRLEISGFNADRSEVVVETFALNYQYFKYYDPANAAMGLAGDLAGSISGGLAF